MKTVKKIFGVSLLTSIMFLIFGLLLLFKPESVINLISGVIGIILIGMGGYSILKYFKEELDEFKFELIYGIVSVIAGLILLINPKTVVSVLPFILGIYFIISGVSKLKYAFEIKKYQGNLPLFMLITSISMMICGILFIFNPFEGALTITKIIGIFMIIYSCLDIVNYISLRKDIKKIGEIIK